MSVLTSQASRYWTLGFAAMAASATLVSIPTAPAHAGPVTKDISVQLFNDSGIRRPTVGFTNASTTWCAWGADWVPCDWTKWAKEQQLAPGSSASYTDGDVYAWIADAPAHKFSRDLVLKFSNPLIGAPSVTVYSGGVERSTTEFSATGSRVTLKYDGYTLTVVRHKDFDTKNFSVSIS